MYLQRKKAPKRYGNSFPPIRFGEILFQPTTWQVNKPSTCTFSHMTFLMSHVTFSNNTCG
jgi:hypothetical protein